MMNEIRKNEKMVESREYVLEVVWCDNEVDHYFFHSLAVARREMSNVCSVIKEQNIYRVSTSFVEGLINEKVL